MANIIIFFIISLSFFDNLYFVGSFDNILVFFPLIIIYGSLVPLIIYGLFGSFDNTLVFFPLIIINLWFVCFFDDSIRVRLVTLLIYRTKMPIRSIMALLVSLMRTSSNWQTS